PGLARHLVLPDLRERQRVRVERHRAIQVANDDRDRVDARDQRLGGRARRECRDRGDGEKRAPQRSRSFRCSPTRSAFAMIVSAGFTAADDGKKLPSTTYKLSSSCALQLTSSADVFGSRPKRTVPFWCATPASGIRSPMKRLRAKRPTWHAS